MQVSKADTVLRTLLIAGMTLALFLPTSCATDSNVGATYDPLSAFPATALWVWDDAQNRLPNDARLDLASIDRNVKSAIEAEFGARGYSKSSASKVHYLMSYEVGIQTWMSQTESRAFASLSVLLTEAASGRKVWLGFVRLQIDRSLTPEESNERLRANLAFMLENFPPAQPE